MREKHVHPYVYPLENARALRVYGTPGMIGKCVILSGERNPPRYGDPCFVEIQGSNGPFYFPRNPGLGFLSPGSRPAVIPAREKQMRGRFMEYFLVPVDRFTGVDKKKFTILTPSIKKIAALFICKIVYYPAQTPEAVVVVVIADEDFSP